VRRGRRTLYNWIPGRTVRLSRVYNYYHPRVSDGAEQGPVIKSPTEQRTVERTGKIPKEKFPNALQRIRFSRLGPDAHMRFLKRAVPLRYRVYVLLLTTRLAMHTNAR
jgi:hypothetical protein